MTSEEINAVIDNLCEKLGTTASKLLPEIAKVKTAECIVTTAIMACITVLVTIFMAYSFKKNVAEQWDSEAWTGLCIVSCIAELFVMVIFGCAIIDLAGWLAFPTAKALFAVIDMVK